MRNNHLFTILLAGILSLVTSLSFAQETDSENTNPESKAINTKEGVDEHITHHLRDSHYFDFFSDGEKGIHYGFALPVIIVDNGFKVFSASEFERGDKIVEKGGQHYKLYHSHIYKVDEAGTFDDFDKNGFPNYERPLDLSITKNVLVIILMGIFIFFVFKSMAKSYQKQEIPKGFARYLEPIILFVRDDIGKEMIGPKYKKFTSFLLTIFFFILFMNFLGMLPFGVNVTGNITVTFTLALLTFIIVQFSGTKDYWKHIFWFPDVHPIMKIILIPIEILGMFTKPFALMIRLFANMTAGHVIIMSLLGFIVVFQNWIAGPAFFGFSLFMMVIEILVAILQAYIFTMLSALYIGGAVQEHYDDHEEEEVPVI